MNVEYKKFNINSYDMGMKSAQICVKSSLMNTRKE